MSGEHSHPEYALADPTAESITLLQTRVEQITGELTQANARMSRLTAQVVALEAADATTATRLAALEADVLTYRYLGKPNGTLTVGGSYTDLDGSRWDPPGSGWEHTLIYLNVTPTFKTGKTRGALRVRLMRADGDASMYHDHVVTADSLAGGAQLITQTYWEMGDGTANRVQLKCIGGLAKVEIGTRYTKRALLRD